MEKHHETDPEFYERNLGDESSRHRAVIEGRLNDLYEKAGEEKNPILRRKLYNQVDLIEQQLSLQGANPKVVPFDMLVEHVRAKALNYDDLSQYKSKIKNRATAIRAYCVGCMGGSVSDVRSCSSLCCPLHPFRMGKDPLRGYELPKVDEPELEIEDDEDDFFEEGDDGSDADAN